MLDIVYAGTRLQSPIHSNITIGSHSTVMLALPMLLPW